MHRIPPFLGLILITGLVIHKLYEFIVPNEGIHYFLSNPLQLKFAVFLGILGGMIIFTISQVSLRLQHILKLFAIGGFGLFFIAGALFSGFIFHALLTAPLIYEGTPFGWVLS